MNPVMVGLGVVAILYGLFTAYMRATNPTSSRKLEQMKKTWGDSAVTTVHVIAYSVVPIVVGVSMLIGGLKGVSLFDF